MEKTVLYENIDRLVQYGLTTGLTSKEEEIYTRNQLLEVFGEEDYQENDKTGKSSEDRRAGGYPEKSSGLCGRGRAFKREQHCLPGSF